MASDVQRIDAGLDRRRADDATLALMSASVPVLTRRRLLALGAGAAAVFAVAGGAAWLWRPGWRGGQLTDSGRAVFRAVARVVLEGALPADPEAANAALDRHLLDLDRSIAGFPAATQAELSQLLGLLSVSAGRQWLTGLASDWSTASEVELEAALRRMRLSDQGLRQQAYHALRDLTNAAFYAQPDAWSAMGYPGPTRL